MQGQTPSQAAAYPGEADDYQGPVRTMEGAGPKITVRVPLQPPQGQAGLALCVDQALSRPARVSDAQELVFLWQRRLGPYAVQTEGSRTAASTLFQPGSMPLLPLEQDPRAGPM